MESANIEEKYNETVEEENICVQCCLAIICCPVACWVLCMNEITGGALTAGNTATKSILGCLCPCWYKRNTTNE